MKINKLPILAILLIFTASMAQAQTADEIIARALNAAGGEAALKNINTLKITLNVSIPAQGIEFAMIAYSKRPNLARQDGEVMGMSFTQAYDGKIAWWVMPFQGITEPTEASEDITARFARGNGVDDIYFDREKRGVTCTFAGVEEDDGRKLNHITVTYKDGHVQERYYDAETGFMVKTSQMMTTAMGEMKDIRTYSDFREVAGVKFAHSVESTLGQNITTQEIIVNEPIDDEIFRMPPQKEETSDEK